MINNFKIQQTMKNKGFFTLLHCDNNHEYSAFREKTSENQQKEIQSENGEGGFMPFDIDYVFAN